MSRYQLTIKEITYEEDYLYITFDKPKDLDFEDGQYGVFLHVEKEFEGRKMRAFSFASSHKENVLTIGTKAVAHASPFKEAMKLLQPKDHMTVDGPMGRFTLEPKHHAVFIAGGIGITPIRGILRGMDSYEKATLVWSESSENYPFLEDIEAMPGLDLKLTSGIGPTKYQIEQEAHFHNNQAVYYIVGSPGFVNGVNDQIKALGILQENIKFDRFTGY